MKWIPIEKAKVKFGQVYLVHNSVGDVVANLDKSETTKIGIKHSFKAENDEIITDATHVAIITDPTVE